MRRPFRFSYRHLVWRNAPNSKRCATKRSKKLPRVVFHLAVLGTLGLAGCSDTPQVVPVSGRVLYNGKPLEFGTVMFQPKQGQAAVGEIQPDGSFVLSTYEPGDGAVPGSHKVCVRCYEGQRPGVSLSRPGEEVTLGALLVPRKYTRFGTSGLTAEVKLDGTEPIELNLTGPPGR